MKTIDQYYTHLPVGAVCRAADGRAVDSHDHSKGKGTTFTVWAPKAQSAHLVLNKDTITLESQPYGYWSAWVPEAKPGDLYQFQLDENEPLPDPASLAQPSGVHGPSEVIDLHGFQWHDQGWTGIPMADMIIYELHVGTFTQEGTFMAITDKLDYLQELGINAIEIMPVAQFPGERNWGYDGVYPYAAQHSYGGALGLMQLVDACHQAGIAVILDVVYNHLGPEGNYLPTYGPYLTDKHHTPWGMAINMDDAYCDGVRHYFLQNALMWLRDFRIDGLRLDAVHAIKDTSARHFLTELSAQVDALAKETQRTYTLIGECDLNDSRYISARERGGYGLTGQWIDEFHHSLHAFITGEQEGYYSDFGAFDHIVKAFEKTYVYDGVYSPHRKKIFGNSAEGHDYDQFVVFSQNHDQVGNRMMGDRLTTQVSLETLKLLAGAVLLSPAVPMLFMGEEYGEKKPFQYFVSHTDPDLVEAVRQGRSREFAYFQREGHTVPDPQSKTTFRDSTLSWDRTQKASATLFRWYQHLIRLRKTLPALMAPQRAATQVSSPQEQVLILARSSEPAAAPALYCVFNLGEKAVTLSSFTELPLKIILDSADAEWQGPGTKATNEAGVTPTISMSGRSLQIYEIENS